jgi:trehalose 6-phosphate synthase/phosphatase
MAGASIELIESLIVNPNNIEEIKHALYKALTMSEQEQNERMAKMQQVIRKQNVVKWALDFINELELAGIKQDENNKKILTAPLIEQLHQRFLKASKRLLLLDYDGTLAPYASDPLKATPDPDLLGLLDSLANYEGTTVVIVSGRDFDVLGKWLPGKKLVLFAEHGAFFREGEVWSRNYIPKEEWKEEILGLIGKITDKTPGSFVEIKNSAVVWHYRKTDAWLAELREKQLIESLVYPCSKLNLQIMRGNNIVEVKEPGVNKGLCALQMLKEQKWDFIVSIGDDTTDEDMFRVLPSDAITIKVGKVSENAGYNLSSYRDVLFLLNKFIS